MLVQENLWGRGALRGRRAEAWRRAPVRGAGHALLDDVTRKVFARAFGEWRASLAPATRGNSATLRAQGQTQLKILYRLVLSTPVGVDEY